MGFGSGFNKEYYKCEAASLNILSYSVNCKETKWSSENIWNRIGQDIASNRVNGNPFKC